MDKNFKMDVQQQAIMLLFEPVIELIVEKVSERVLSVAKKEIRYYSRKEIADILHVTLPTLARLTRDGLINCNIVGSRILYQADDIDEAVKKQVIFKYRRA